MNKTIAVYVFFLLLFALFSYLFVDVNLIYMHVIFTGIANNNRLLVSATYAIFILGFFAFYIYFLKDKNLNLKNIKKLIFVSFLILVFSYPAMLSYDIFNYYSTAKVTFFYRENPYWVMPIEFTNDPMLLFTRAANKYALYGPFWIMLTGIPFVLGFNNFIMQLFLLKITSGLFYLGSCFFIYKLSKKLSPLVFFALNPLVLIETLVSSHNDMSMVFLVLLTYYLAKEKRFFSSVLFYIFSILIKYATIILSPVCVYIIIKGRLKKEINWDKVWLYSAALMFFVFLLSPIREEVYPWYFIWIIPFISLLEGYKKLKILTVVSCLGLLLSYIPYMFMGSYVFPEQLIKNIIIALPPIVSIFYLYIIKYGKNI